MEIEKGGWKEFDRAMSWGVSILVFLFLIGGYVLNDCKLF